MISSIVHYGPHDRGTDPLFREQVAPYPKSRSFIPKQQILPSGSRTRELTATYLSFARIIHQQAW
eukprot:8178454-Prorocentrum_lima.AAC.1